VAVGILSDRQIACLLLEPAMPEQALDIVRIERPGMCVSLAPFFAIGEPRDRAKVSRGFCCLMSPRP
jgi:hypothetical protein